MSAKKTKSSDYRFTQEDLKIIKFLSEDMTVEQIAEYLQKDSMRIHRSLQQMRESVGVKTNEALVKMHKEYDLVSGELSIQVDNLKSNHDDVCEGLESICHENGLSFEQADILSHETVSIDIGKGTHPETLKKVLKSVSVMLLALEIDGATCKVVKSNNISLAA